MARAGLLRLVGGLLVLAGGLIHLSLAFDDYGTASIGRAFALNALASGVVVLLLALDDGPVGPLAGIAVSAGSLVAFGLSRVGGGFLGFEEAGFSAPHSALTVAVEALALLVCAAALADGRREAVGHPRPS